MTTFERFVLAVVTIACLGLGYAVFKDDAYTIDKRENTTQAAIQSCVRNGGIVHLDKDMKFTGCDIIMGAQRQ